MKRELILTTTAVLLLTTGVAAAQTNSTTTNNTTVTKMNLHKGWYGELNIGTNWYSIYIRTDYPKDNYDWVSYFGGTALNVNAGYQFNNYFALEAGYNIVDGGRHVLHVAGKGILPLGNRFSVFGKLGLSMEHYDYKDSALFLGVGGSYALTPKLDLTIQETNNFAHKENYGTLTAGLTYHFSN